ncbi:MAG: exported protein of unknown function, partial [Anaerolineales bacterium]|nr:exported protein of unknown function [Anaerolineales bacterium]
MLRPYASSAYNVRHVPTRADLRDRMSRRPSLFPLAALAAAVFLGLAAITLSPASAGVASAPAARPPANPANPANDECLACHASPGQTVTLPSGELLVISVDSGGFDQSVHGQEGLVCLDCHPGNGEVPHAPVTAQSRREYVLQRYTACAECHADKYEATLDSVHQRALAGGNLEAAVCTD